MSGISNKILPKSFIPDLDTNRVYPNNIAVKAPELLKQWNWEKNYPERPEYYSSNSNKYFWWHCDICNGDYQAPIGNKFKGTRCPYCTGKKVLKGFNDFKSKCPDKAIYWDYEKNYPLRPDEVTKGSNKKVFWKCKLGHSFQSIICDVGHGHWCPYCTGRLVKPGFNDLATFYPDLVKNEWDYEKNAPVLPTAIARASTYKAWWICPFGHSYQATVNSRISSGSGCPVCNNARKTSLPEQAIFYYISQIYSDAINRDTDTIGMELDIYIPSIKTAIEYDGIYHKSDVSEVREVRKNKLCTASGINLIRIRVEGLKLYNDCHCIVHEHTTTLGSIDVLLKDLFSYLNLPIDGIDIVRDMYTIQSKYAQVVKNNSIAQKMPNIALEWNYEKNGQLSPDYIHFNTAHKYWWKCSDCGYEWKMSPYQRRKGSRCPKCLTAEGRANKVISGANDLATARPDLLKEWDYAKNILKPSEVGVGSEIKTWWICPKGHSYETITYHRTGKQACGCPYCAKNKCFSGYNDLQTLEPELVERFWDFEKNILKPDEVAATTFQKAFWKCKECGYEWESPISARSRGANNKYVGCPSCNKRRLKEGPKSLFEPVYCIELNQTFISLSEASRQTGANKGSIRDNINGKLGRAGRKGIYETGYYTATSNFKRIKELYKAAPDSVEKAVLPLPRQLIEYYPPLSNSLVWWNAAIAPDLYEKSDITGIPKLAHDLEELTDSKELIYDLITIPFDSEIEEVYELWYALSKDYIENNPIDIISYLKYILDFSTLEALELSYKQCDLMFYFMRSICRSDLRDLEIIVRSKEEISQKIIKYLENQAYSEKKCRKCGKALPYNFKYGICETCYRKM